MHRMNNVVIMQTKQLGRIKALEEELCSFKAKTEELSWKLEEQDHVITNLVGDNLEHLQDNMCLTAHINSLQKCMMQMEMRLEQVGSVLMGMIEGAMEGEEMDSLEVKMSDASGNDQDDQDGDVGNRGTGVSMEESMRRDSPMPQEGGLIEEMEREAIEAGAGGWFNGNPEEVLESWSGRNSVTLSSQDQVGTILLTTIGGQTLPDPVKVPNNLVHPVVLRAMMEGPV